MKTLTTNSSNDLAVSGRSLTLSTDLEAVLRVARHCARAIQGEMVFARTQGMPYFQTVWVGAPSTAPFEAAFRARIQQIEGVTGIEELTAERTGEAMTYTATITTVYGTGTVNG